MTWAGTPPPRRIATERFLLRRYEPADAPLLKDAVDSSIDHLRPFMPWTPAEPQPLADSVELLRSFGAQFDSGEQFVFGIFARGERELLGGTGLHPRIGPGALEIGYWVRSSAVRRGIATEVTSTLARVAFDVCGAERVELRIDPANVASLGVPRKLGFARAGYDPERGLEIFSLLRSASDSSTTSA
jgi:RimJ/RimL family protein N-acetyltransferase